MVYRPGETPGPSHDPNKWTVYTKNWFDKGLKERRENAADVMADTVQLAADIESLIQREGMDGIFKITSVNPERAYVQIDCDPAFGEKLRQLPNAGHAQYVVYAELMSSPPLNLANLRKKTGFKPG